MAKNQCKKREGSIEFSPNDLTTWDREMTALSGVRYAGS